MADQRPRKPRKDFPLFPHRNGLWAKKVQGRFVYFGKWASDPTGEAAEARWDADKGALKAGRQPRTRGSGGVSVEVLFNTFLTWKRGLVDSQELAPRSFEDYVTACGAAADSLGRSNLVGDLRPDDFERLRATLAKRWGPTRLGNMIVFIKMAFTYAVDVDLIEHPVKFGPGFKKPSAKTARQQRAAKGPKKFEAHQILALLEKANPLMRCLVLLGANGGLGNTDLALMPRRALDLDSGWLNYPRHKTAVDRRIPLWPETVEAITAYLAVRPQPNDAADAGLVFISERGLNLVGKYHGERITNSFDRLAKRAHVEGRAFYDLRRTFQTIGEGARDLSAVQAIMGHAAAAGDMSARYRQTIEDARLQAVVDHVHRWLFDTSKAKPR